LGKTTITLTQDIFAGQQQILLPISGKIEIEILITLNNPGSNIVQPAEPILTIRTGDFRKEKRKSPFFCPHPTQSLKEGLNF